MNCEPFQIRKGCPADFAEIDAFDPFAGDRRDELDRGRCFVAVCAERIAGYVSFSPDGFIGHPFMHFLAVAPAFRRRGIATALIRAVEAAIGPRRFFASTEEDNREMRQMFERGGWIPAGSVHGVNGPAGTEVFFYRDIPGGERDAGTSVPNPPR